MTSTQLPGALRLVPSFAFVGRSRELRRCGRSCHWRTVRGAACVVGGEPAPARAGSSVSSRTKPLPKARWCSTARVMRFLRTPYRPFVEALDYLVRHVDPTTLRADLGNAGGELARLLPDLSSRVDDLRTRSSPTRTRSATVSTQPSPISSRASGVVSRCSSSSRMGTGQTARRCSSCAISRGRPPTPGCS